MMKKKKNLQNNFTLISVLIHYVDDIINKKYIQCLISDKNNFHIHNKYYTL